MNYFVLSYDKHVTNPIRIVAADINLYQNDVKKEQFDKVSDLKVGYFENAPDVEICDVLEKPAFFVSDQLKRLFGLFEPDIEWKGIQVFSRHMEDHTAPLYWWPYLAPLDCLSEQTKKLQNGMLKELVLRRDKIKNKSIFRAAGLLEYKIVVSLEVAECMLRREMTGFGLEIVKITE